MVISEAFGSWSWPYNSTDKAIAFAGAILHICFTFYGRGGALGAKRNEKGRIKRVRILEILKCSQNLFFVSLSHVEFMQVAYGIHKDFHGSFTYLTTMQKV